MTPQYRPSHTILLSSAVVLALAPFGVAILRVIRTGNDVRYLWVAVAAFVGALGVALIIGARGRARDIIARQAVIAFLVSTLLAVRVARMLGANSWPGVIAVCVVFALFFTATTTLYALSRTQQI